MKRIFLSVVIPSYNETENLKRGVLAEVRDYLSLQKYSWEVIVSDDGSVDEAKKLAKEFCENSKGFTYLQNEHAGKPFAVWSGVQKAQGEIVLLTDMDQSAPIFELEKILPCYKENYDIVIGSRGTERKSYSLLRRIGSVIFKTFRQSIILPNIVDTQAGFKSFKLGIGLKIFPKLQVIRQGNTGAKGWSVGSWDTEFLFIADKLGYKIREVPILWENRDMAVGTKKSGSGKYLKESVEMVQQMFRVRVNDLRGYYNKA